MVVINSTEFRDRQKEFFSLAITERLIIRQGRQFFELLPRGNSIPENPSPSGDIYFNDSENIAAITAGIAQIKAGKGKLLTKKQQQKMLGL